MQNPLILITDHKLLHLHHPQTSAIAYSPLALNGTGRRGDLLAIQEQRHIYGNAAIAAGTAAEYTGFETAHFRVQYKVGRYMTDGFFHHAPALFDSLCQSFHEVRHPTFIICQWANIRYGEVQH